jgi:uncharacterized protein (TIGR03382 family)
MRLAGFAVLAVLLAPTIATAEATFQLERRPVPATAATARAASRTIYLNRRGATLTPGQNNSRTNTSSIVSKPSTVPPWGTSDAKWAETVACLHEIWAPFDVALTDTDPGSTPHIEALFGGSPTDVGMPSGVGGVSPFAIDCGVIENAIVFAFTERLPDNPRIVCEVMSQEIGHAYGLDHELLASDPMTYLSFSGERSFRDQTAACGESQARPCGIGATACRANQNSVQLLRERLGEPGDDGSPPQLRIASPLANAVVDPGFTITANADDDVAAVTFFVDGDQVGAAITPPYQLATDASLLPGDHTIVVEAADTRGNVSMAQVDVVVRGADDGVDDNPLTLLGCSATGGTAGFPVALALLALLRRPRRREAPTSVQ